MSQVNKLLRVSTLFYYKIVIVVVFTHTLSIMKALNILWLYSSSM